MKFFRLGPAEAGGDGSVDLNLPSSAVLLARSAVLADPGGLIVIGGLVFCKLYRGPWLAEEGALSNDHGDTSSPFGVGFFTRRVPRNFLLIREEILVEGRCSGAAGAGEVNGGD